MHSRAAAAQDTPYVTDLSESDGQLKELSIALFVFASSVLAVFILIPYAWSPTIELFDHINISLTLGALVGAHLYAWTYRLRSSN